jgi:hypothetical protein
MWKGNYAVDVDYFPRIAVIPALLGKSKLPGLTNI